jgi:hypothetical protein
MAKEATFHFELYRVLHMLLRTSIYPAPEFGGDSDGHSLDLRIPGPRWGLELTYDGRRLLGHMDRFSQTGQYGQWLATGEMTDFMVLDFRPKKPATQPLGKDISPVQTLSHGLMTVRRILKALVHSDRQRLAHGENFFRE